MSRAREALKAAMAAQGPVEVRHALAPHAPETLHALAARARSRVMTGADYDALAALAVAAATYGYPAPALERLGREASRVPTARTSDPSTSKDATLARVPSLRNQLGRLLAAYAWRVFACAEDPTMTSEEAAHVAGLSPRSEYAKRASELQALGYLRVARDADGHERTRRGAAGPQRLVFEMTDAGAALGERLRAEAVAVAESDLRRPSQDG